MVRKCFWFFFLQNVIFLSLFSPRQLWLLIRVRDMISYISETVHFACLHIFNICVLQPVNEIVLHSCVQITYINANSLSFLYEFPIKLLATYNYSCIVDWYIIDRIIIIFWYQTKVLQCICNIKYKAVSFILKEVQVVGQVTDRHKPKDIKGDIIPNNALYKMP